MTSRHLVRPGRELELTAPPDATAEGLRRWSVVDEGVPGAVHTGFAIVELDRGGRIPWHVHSYEDSLYVLEGEVVVDTGEGANLLRPGDYGVTPVGAPHALRNVSDAPVRWAGMWAPQPRSRVRGDTYAVPALPERTPTPIDVRDPRTRSFGHIDPANMEVDKQTQDMLAVSASMRTALLVYSGITVKMMVDADLGAQLLTMFMVQYEPRGLAGRHDHPYEETYLILEGEVDAEFDGERYHLVPGDVAWAGVGCVHAFTNPGPGDRALARDAGAATAASPLLPIRPGLGVPERHDERGRNGRRWLSTRWSWWAGPTGSDGTSHSHYADAGRRVVVTGRDAERAAAAAAELGASVEGLAFDLAEPTTIAAALAGVGSVDRLVLAALERDLNTVKDYDIGAALRLVTLKLVGYTEVIHSLLPRLTPDASILLYGGLAKLRPYPGSTTITTINHGVDGLVRSLAIEIAPIRVNALHPGIVADSPFWAPKTEALEATKAKTPTGRLVTMRDVTDAAVFLLENPSMHGSEIQIDGGWSLT